MYFKVVGPRTKISKNKNFNVIQPCGSSIDDRSITKLNTVPIRAVASQA